MSRDYKVKDNFDLLKDDFEQKFCKKWNEDPQLYLQFYQARVLDAMLLLFSTKLNDNQVRSNEIEESIKNSLESLIKADKN